MHLCSNRPEGFGPLSHLYPHTLTSCFLDTILIPLCTWLYLLIILLLHLLPSRLHPTHRAYTPGIGFRSARRNGSTRRWSGTNNTHKDSADIAVEDANIAADPSSPSPHRHRTAKNRKLHIALLTLYYLLLLAQTLMVILEITRLSLTHLGIGLLPFTFVTLLVAFTLHLTSGFRNRIPHLWWRGANIGVWLALAVVNGVKIAGEVKEGQAAGGGRKGSKYPESDEIIDVAVMVGVYVVLAGLEVGTRS